jgi:alpha-L-fucosidase
LEEIGRWMAVNGEAIYSSSATPFRRLAWGRCTQKPGKLYLHVFDWPKGDLNVPSLKNKVVKAYLLADPEKKPLQFASNDKGVTVKVPENAPDPIASVVVLEIEGVPQVEQPIITQAADGTIVLTASEANLHGQDIKYEAEQGRDNIGYWTNKRDYVSWDFTLKTAGKYEVEITLSCGDNKAGSEYTVAVGRERVTGTVEDTGDWSKYTTKKLGVLNLTNPGQQNLSVRPRPTPQGTVMNLKSIVLKPVAGQ